MSVKHMDYVWEKISGVKACDKAVLIYFAQRQSGKQPTWLTVTLAEIGTSVCSSARTIQRSLDRLVPLGLIAKQCEAGSSCRYSLGDLFWSNYPDNHIDCTQEVQDVS